MFPGSGTQKSLKSNKRSSSIVLSPPSATKNKNRYSPLSNLNEDVNVDTSLVIQSDDETQQFTEVSQKIPPIYVHNIKDIENFHNYLVTIITDKLSITQTKNALKNKFVIKRRL